MFLSDISLKRPIAMSTVIFALIVIGAFSYQRLNIEFLPKVDFPYVTVTTQYPGAGPKEIETLISKEIEDAVSEVDGIKHVRSTSMENISQVFIEFELGTNVDFAAIDVREKVDAIKSDLPDDAEAPIILKYDVNAKPIMNLAIIGKRPLNEIYDFVDKIIKDQLTKIPGVASVDIVGGKRREIQILVDQDQLIARNINITDIIQALKNSNIDLPSGHITEKYYEYTVRLDGEFDQVEQMKAIELHIQKGHEVKTIPLIEIAEIKDAFEEQRELAYYNGQECVGLVIKKRADANTVKSVERVRKALSQINTMIPQDIQLQVVNDDSKFIKYSVKDVVDNIILGIMLTAIVLYLFLHDIKSTVIAGVSMPVSIVSTFSLMHFAGFTLNIMSLMALAISVGVLVTNSIIVIENIHRYISTGLNSKESAAKGTAEIALAVMGSTLTNVVVFLPIAFMSGIVGQFFMQFGLSVTFATLVSLFISFTLTPILFVKLFSNKVSEQKKKENLLTRALAKWDLLYDWLAEKYLKILCWTLSRRLITILGSSVLFIAAMQIPKYLGSEMTTEPDRAELTITAEMPPGYTLDRTRKAFIKIDKIVSEKFKDVITGRYIKIGKIEGLFGKSSQGIHLGELLVTLTDKSDRKETVYQIIEKIRQALSNNIPAATIIVQQPSAIGGSEAPILIEVLGYKLEKLHQISENISKKLEQTKGTRNIDTTWRAGKPEISVTPMRQRLHDYGLTAAQVAYILRANLQGMVASVYRVDNKEYDIRVKLSEADRSRIDQVKSFYVPLHNGASIPLYNVAQVSQKEGPTQIIRKNKQRVVILSSNNIGRSIGEIWEEMKSYTDNLNMPPGYSVYYGGMIEMMQESFADILLAFLMAVILTYLVLAALLESFIQPFTILLTLPLALIGVFLALFVTNNTISIFSMMAVVMLVGIVVNNGILLIDYTTILRNEGRSRIDALQEACKTRLRPILMTTIATILGMVPLALGLGWGAEMRAPMAIVSIGGLMVSMVLSLVVIPTVYTLFDDLKNFRL